MSKRYRFVIDTNILISSVIVRHGKAQQALFRAIDYGYFLISTDTFAELREVLYRKRFDRYITQEQREQFLQDYLAKSVLVPVTVNLKACHDPRDHMFVDLAISGDADYIITGNCDDFPSSPFQGTQILSPADFLALDLG